MAQSSVVLGMISFWSIIFFSNPKCHLLYRRINHPSYNNGDPPNYDFQLIELSSAVNFADSRLSHVYPACWPSSEPTSGRVILSAEILDCFTNIR